MRFGALRERLVHKLRDLAKRLPGIRSLVHERNSLRARLEQKSKRMDRLETALREERRQLAEERSKFEDLEAKAGFVPPGHRHSPIPSLPEVAKDWSRISERGRGQTIPGIDLREEHQLSLLATFEPFYVDMPFRHDPVEGLRYYLGNGAFEYADGIFLHCMLRHLRPRRIIEVGSGFSSAAMFDTSQLFLDRPPELTFIDPNPERLRSLLLPGDEALATIVERRVQDVPLEQFSELAAGDILFVESTHVARVGSDVNHLMFEVLPSLATGVVVHVHDIGYPFEYPRNWIMQGRAWNEAYLMRAFLQYNSSFQIELFGSYLQQFHGAWIDQHLPLAMKTGAGSLWIRRSGRQSAG